MKDKINKYIWLILFAIAMGYLEAAVVSYLRELYCPGGFTFPFPMPPVKLYLTELGRELSTIVMLVGIAIVSSSAGIIRIAYFLLLFGLWDIFYYFWLYILLQWPTSFLDWDILFSIPVSWAAPVIAPLIVSFLFIGFSVIIFYLHSKGYKIIISFWEGVTSLVGLLLIFLSMTIDALFEPRIYLYQAPSSFHWGLFNCGIIILIIVIGSLTFLSIPSTGREPPL
ncbi:MAG: hypothetical protein COZ37_02135 [bacterium (Candidatus Ratteibacteria) CG_4_10_14_3_um_filter_41_18]|uniref:Uncharacterized protein n=4 Tax=Candidatus Ratteibacteria TaxID=2979319 RepID=A0A2M7YEH4_9BACT|nr:MAG: hypothetical protein AUJ76_02165 [Candidatus Omnitrophica bacterium CG1_02_41_171]PIV64369.1 MAG: hypothetical protein COS11_02525 [bacterium (Candidatus Ratteibacteria) CG01_land_8_20_14_3_00_40_19]PIW33918.1 MAG: hypothetical protein COW28_02015 [bacterium (Candidatus Ratteibacteria) CG15_BIG_FIL_POST_REV_8_21_14_020_41_12]PIW74554.1 MAG: hypothetical protein CO004_00075 [bacterium (Candidatus Ratteibacteria) CG_4_8_14_3_um_filter_41_36]PIX77547.1 MAG: hypothetical protein COZ37_02135